LNKVLQHKAIPVHDGHHRPAASNYLDANWYKSNPKGEGVNITIESRLDQQNLPQIFDADDNGMICAQTASATNLCTIYYKRRGNEYQRIKEMAIPRLLLSCRSISLRQWMWMMPMMYVL